MLSNLGRNLRTFLWSLLLALAVWLAAVTAADPDQVRVYPSPVKIEVVGQDPGLIVDTALPREVDLTLRAPQSVWNQLTARPDSIRAVLDLSGLSAGVHTLNVQIQVAERPVRIVSANPSSVTVKMEPLITKTLPLQSTVTGQPAIGFQPGELTVDPKQVVLAGPQSLVAGVTRVLVTVNITGIREGLDQSADIQALDQNNVRVTNVTIQPAVAHVTLPVRWRAATGWIAFRSRRPW
jgi:YbbR domain-containing protein